MTPNNPADEVQVAKDSLTDADPPGWYLCDFNTHTESLYWNGKFLTLVAGAADEEDGFNASEYANFRAMVQASEQVSKIARLERDLATERESMAWIRKKLDLPDDSQMFSGNRTIAGTLHVWDDHARGYEKYIVTHKCEDKQGELARLSVACAEALTRATASEQQLAASKSEAAHLRAANADLEEACRGFQEQLAAALKRVALADGLAEAVRDEVNFQNCCLNPEPIMYLDELLAALAAYTKGPTA